ncbi:MAG TPA: UpxY family transcription antiterminator [Nitrospirae bacterium]|nr:UpxY family transcription antiterminator [Nitrospirota bacterium]
MKSGSLNWYVLYVKSRHEFVVHNELLKKGVESYLPSVKRLRQWKDRRTFVDFPLFPGYLFVHICADPGTFLSVLKTKGVVSFISLTPDYPAPVSPEEINSLKLLIQSGKEFDVHPFLKEGTRVRVRSGPLKGAEGVLRNKEDQYIFHVNIELLGRSVGVKIYADELEAA